MAIIKGTARHPVPIRLSAEEKGAIDAAAEKAGDAGPSVYIRRVAVQAATGQAPAGDCQPGQGYVGKECGPLITPQTTEQACYEVWPADKLITSHIPGSFEADPRYPAAVQERDYKGDKNERLKVERISKDPKPDLMLALTPTVIDGAPVIASSGVVLGGNGRTMGLKLAYERNTAGAYREALIERAPMYGLERKDVEEIKQPVLVRVVHRLDGMGQQELARASSRYNESLSGSMDERAQAVALARRVSAETLSTIAPLLEEYGTLRKAMDEKPRTFIERFRQDGIFTDQNNAKMTELSGQLTEQGKLTIEGAFLGLVSGSPERLAAAEASTLQKVERITPYLARVQARNAAQDRIPAFQQGMDLLREAKAAGMTIAQLAAQNSMFGPKPDPLAIEAAQLLEVNAKKLGEAAKAWAAVADFDPKQPLLFGKHPTPEETWQTFLKVAEVKPLERPAPAPQVVAESIQPEDAEAEPSEDQPKGRPLTAEEKAYYTASEKYRRAWKARDNAKRSGLPRSKWPSLPDKPVKPKSMTEGPSSTLSAEDHVRAAIDMVVDKFALPSPDKVEVWTRGAQVDFQARWDHGYLFGGEEKLTLVAKDLATRLHRGDFPSGRQIGGPKGMDYFYISGSVFKDGWDRITDAEIKTFRDESMCGDVMCRDAALLLYQESIKQTPKLGGEWPRAQVQSVQRNRATVEIGIRFAPNVLDSERDDFLSYFKPYAKKIKTGIGYSETDTGSVPHPNAQIVLAKDKLTPFAKQLQEKLLGSAKSPDWRPGEAIPEDFYAL